MKIFIAIIIVSILALTGCVNLEEYIPIEEYNFKISELEEANNIIDDKDVEIKGLKGEVNTLENDLDLNEEETEKYKYLLANLNSLLSNVYYGYAENENYTLDGFTAFSIFYNEKYYLLTAGHCVEDKDGRYYNHRFKANFTNEFIYPKLLAYENDFYGNRDYAIFYSDKINSGLNYDLNNSYPSFILGNMNDNALKESSIPNLIGGESGSAVVDIDGEVTGIVTGGYVDIDLVIEAIDKLE